MGGYFADTGSSAEPTPTPNRPEIAAHGGRNSWVFEDDVGDRPSTLKVSQSILYVVAVTKG